MLNLILSLATMPQQEQPGPGQYRILFPRQWVKVTTQLVTYGERGKLVNSGSFPHDHLLEGHQGEILSGAQILDLLEIKLYRELRPPEGGVIKFTVIKVEITGAAPPLE